MNKRKSRPTSLYEIESRDADEKLAEARKKEMARREEAVTTPKCIPKTSANGRSGETSHLASLRYLKAVRAQRCSHLNRYLGGRRIELP